MLLVCIVLSVYSQWRGRTGQLWVLEVLIFMSGGPTLVPSPPNSFCCFLSPHFLLTSLTLFSFLEIVLTSPNICCCCTFLIIYIIYFTSFTLSQIIPLEPTGLQLIFFSFSSCFFYLIFFLKTQFCYFPRLFMLFILHIFFCLSQQLFDLHPTVFAVSLFLILLLRLLLFPFS